MTEYTVKTGDTLCSIAQRELGDALLWPKIYEANQAEMDAAWLRWRGYFKRLGSKSVTHPADYIRFGQKLRLPT